MMPRAGGQYVYLREAYSPLWGFLYGWTLFMVIQTGTIAAVVGGVRPLHRRARFRRLPRTATSIAPIHVSTGYALSLSTAQLLGVALIALLTWTNTRGLEYGKVIQNTFTTAKTGALAALILVGLVVGWNADAVATNFGQFWTPRGFEPIAEGVAVTSAFGDLHRALRGADRLAVLGGRLEQHHVHGRRGQGSAPEHSAVAGARHHHRHLAVPARQPRVPRDAAARGDSAGAVRSRRDLDARCDLSGRWARRSWRSPS